MPKKASIIALLTVAALLSIQIAGCGEDDVTNDPPDDPIDPESVTDIDGNVYQVVRIGDRWWMAENLKVTHYRNGDTIHRVTDNAWVGLTTGAWCEYENDPSHVSAYGRLYNWHAAGDSRNIAPEGWHLPTNEDVRQLELYLANEANDGGGKLKEAGTSHWRSPNTGATNETGFSALPGGVRETNGSFHFFGTGAYFWAQEYGTSNEAKTLWLEHAELSLSYSPLNKRRGHSIRCVMD